MTEQTQQNSHHYQEVNLDIGLASVDITPEIGVYHRCWGASLNDTAEGIHKALSASAIAFSEDEELCILISADASFWQSKSLEENMRSQIAKELELTTEQLFISITHTHASVPLFEPEDTLEGSKLLKEYLVYLEQQLIQVCKAALKDLKPSSLQCNYGHCELATQRDFYNNGEFLVGYNPQGEADTTLVSGRIVTDTGSCRGTFLNYACHPTTLAWENKDISPDYIGECRDVIQSQHSDGPFLFLQGASGDLAPARQYSGKSETADQNGRILAYAALSALSHLPKPHQEFKYVGLVKSGADLALWEDRYKAPQFHSIQLKQVSLTLSANNSFPSKKSVETELSQTSNLADRERLLRKFRLLEMINDDHTIDFQYYLAKLGKLILVSFPAEAYSLMQVELRKAFPDSIVMVMNNCNGSSGYLIPESYYERPSFYPAWQTPYGKGSFERVLEHCIDNLQNLELQKKEMKLCQ